MSTPLVYECRPKITLETEAALQAEMKVTGNDKNEIAREVLHRWALIQVEKARVIAGVLKREGISGQTGA
jgi:hypothetical protein